ncbi:MAG: DUF1059 domain-containing protein [bacterium]|nr:DUF1059 domain-containing protein [bacterium]
MVSATRKMIDCRWFPSETQCSLTIAGTEEEVLTVARQHAVASHGHKDDQALVEALRGAMRDEG